MSRNKCGCIRISHSWRLLEDWGRLRGRGEDDRTAGGNLEEHTIIGNSNARREVGEW